MSKVAILILTKMFLLKCGKQKIQELDNLIPANLPRCCSQVNFYDLENSPNDEPGLERINCLLNPRSGSGSTGQSCQSNFREIDFTPDQVNITDDELSFHLHRYSTDSPPIKIPTTSTDFCIGVGFDRQFSVQSPLKTYLVYCRPPCLGKKPCLR